MSVSKRHTLAIAIALACAAPAAFAQSTLPRVEVTSSKLPESVDIAPAMVTIVDGDEMRARGAVDLRTALALTAGADIGPGGDNGPAGSVPGFWGLKEFDAFLLVVDGVPYGGAFNPALTTLDLENVKRIEVLRGAAPVTFGATSFVGVVHVIHYAPGETPSRATLAGGSRSTGRASISIDLPDWGAFKQSIAANASTNEFSQDRSKVERLHLLYRNAAELDFGHAHFDLDVTSLNQDPYSPHPREGTRLTDAIPLDANHNPRDARQDEDRVQLNGGIEVPVAIGTWNTLVSVAHTNGRNTKGFLRDDFAVADGYRQSVEKTDFYFDTFVATTPAESLKLAFGLDWLYGRGEQKSKNFEYEIDADGHDAPDSHTITIDEATKLNDRRNFGGLYVQADWNPVEPLTIDAGVRLNSTHEKRHGEAVDLHAEDPADATEASSDSRTKTRLSGAFGASWQFWKESDGDHFTAFADYRNTYKPAAIDFGPEAEGEILEPETAHGFEAGVKGRFLEGRLEFEASYFHLNFDNLVIAENVGGLPALANAGSEIFKGAELEASWQICPDFRAMGSYAYHDARFDDYARLRPDGSIQQLGGNRLELSPQNIGALGLIYSPAQGFRASAVYERTGARFLNKGNTAVAGAFHTFDAGVGYRWENWELRVDGYNLSDDRAPVAESELGDAQFYRLSGRSWLLSATVDW